MIFIYITCPNKQEAKEIRLLAFAFCL